MLDDELRRLSEDGLLAYPPSGLNNLASRCQDHCWANPDASRYCVLANLFSLLDDGWGDAQPASLVDDLDRTLRDHLPVVVGGEDPESKLAAAVALRADCLSLMFP